MSKIEKIEGEPYLENHYNLYSSGRIVAKDVPFETLAAALEMLEALERLSAAIDNYGGDLHNKLEGVQDARDAIAKAKGGSDE